MSVECPSCKGSGRVSAEKAVEIYQAVEYTRPSGSKLYPGDNCHCDGPPHPYDPAWCGVGRQ